MKTATEVVRRRIDELGTKEPTILQQGTNRIFALAGQARTAAGDRQQPLARRVDLRRVAQHEAELAARVSARVWTWRAAAICCWRRIPTISPIRGWRRCATIASRHRAARNATMEATFQRGKSSMGSVVRGLGGGAREHDGHMGSDPPSAYQQGSGPGGRQLSAAGGGYRPTMEATFQRGKSSMGSVVRGLGGGVDDVGQRRLDHNSAA
jgi:hypothetical protein